jgi:hypothetical protein
MNKKPTFAGALFHPECPWLEEGGGEEGNKPQKQALILEYQRRKGPGMRATQPHGR